MYEPLYNIGDTVFFNEEGILDHELDENNNFINEFVIVDFLKAQDDFAYLVESKHGAFLTFAANDNQFL